MKWSPQEFFCHVAQQGGWGGWKLLRDSPVRKKKKEKHTHTQKKSWVSWEGEKKEKLTGGYSKMYSLEGKWICQWLAPNEWQKTGTSNSFVCGIIDVCSSCLPCVCRTCLCKHTHAYKQQHRAKKNEKRIHKVSESSRREGIINRIFTSVFGNRSDGAAQLQLGAATKKFWVQWSGGGGCFLVQVGLSPHLTLTRLPS